MLKNVSKSFGKNQVLENINFEFDKNTALVGLNGVGKTTLMRILLGIDKKISGEVKVISDASVAFSDNVLPEYITILELVKSANLDLNKFEDMLKKFDVEKYKNTLIKNLSLGTKKKMNIIFSLLLKRDYLIMDEPTNGLDYQSIYNLTNILKKDTRIKLIISHDFNFIDKVCDNVAILYKKKLIENANKKQLLEKYNKENLEEIFNYLVDNNESK